jgi:hypothetical protein
MPAASKSNLLIPAMTPNVKQAGRGIDYPHVSSDILPTFRNGLGKA